MSEDTRDLLTWICLAILGPAAFFLWRGQTDADWIFSSLAGTDRSIRNRINRGKRFLTLAVVALFACIQGSIHFSSEIRTLLFFVACVFIAWGAFFIWRGYHLWRSGIEGSSRFR